MHAEWVPSVYFRKLALCCVLFWGIAGSSLQASSTVKGHRFLPDALQGQSYAYTLSLETPLTLGTGSLPNGLSLNLSTAAVSGAATESGTFSQRVTDTNGEEWLLHVYIADGGYSPEVQRFDGAGPHAVTSYTVDLTVELPFSPFFDQFDTNAMVVAHPATVADGTELPVGQYPVIILMHGSSYQAIQYQQLLRRLASWGFIALAPTRTEADGSKYNITDGVWTAYPVQVWDWLLEQDEDSQSRFHGHVDEESLLLIGHSWGYPTVAWIAVTGQLPVRALVSMDGVNMVGSAEHWIPNGGYFSEPVAYPEIPTLVLHGHKSAYDGVSYEYGAAFSASHVLIGSANATHTNYRDPAYAADGDVVQVSVDTQNLSVHAITAFAKRYLEMDSSVTGTLFGPKAAGLVESIGQSGSSWAAFRPGAASGKILDDFSDDELGTPTAGGLLTVQGAVQVDVGPPHRSRLGIYAVPDFGLEVIGDILDEPEYSCLALWGEVATPLLVTWDFSSVPQQIGGDDLFILEWAQGDPNFGYVPDLTPKIRLRITDKDGRQVVLNEGQLLSGPWSGTDRRAMLVPGGWLSEIDRNSIHEIQLELESETIDIQVEIDRVRIERDWLAPTAASSVIANTLSNTAIQVKWNDNSSDETAFLLQRAEEMGEFTTVTRTATGVVSFEDSGLDPDTLYRYRVIASNEGLEAMPSAEASGRSYSYQQQYFIDSGLEADVDPTLDSDGDLLTNGDEFKAGTNPNAAASVFRLDLLPQGGGGLQVQTDTVNGKYYRVSWRASLLNGSWQVLPGGEGTVAQSGSPLALPADQPGFYKVEVSDTPW